MKDYMVRGTAANAQLRIFAATTRQTVEAARIAHGTSPVMTAALGRLLTAGAMMGSMMKGEEDILTLQIRGEGPGKGLTVTADSKGNVKGYALVPCVILPANEKGKLDVGGALMGRENSGTTGAEDGRETAPAANVGGILSVIKDLGMKEPYAGQTVLQTGEIAEDLTYYFAVSEQTPSSVGLGVLMEKNNTVKQAGGFIIQLMPFAEDAVIEKLEQNLQHIKPVTTMLEEGLTPEGILETVLEGMDIEWTDTLPVQFYCNCDKARVEKALVSIGAKELTDIIADGKPIEVKCHFCNRAYEFTIEDLEKLLCGMVLSK
ncbi:MAG: Hsp33 family molecular chaperone HslO [Lachnospiraceae bacterium]|nr:Hsp33 family molecular chaperone HslO [Lachnospiraceae bacterium]